MFGWTADEAIGQLGSILFTPEDRERREDAKQTETARTQGTAPDVRWHVRKDGSRIFIEGSLIALRAGGRLGGFLKIGQNVTERRRAEERERALIEGIPQLVWRAVDGGRWQWSSPQWSAYTGLSQEESRELGWLDAVHPEDRDHIMAAWHEAEVKGAFAVESTGLAGDQI